jgi:hypothetical protein
MPAEGFCAARGLKILLQFYRIEFVRETGLARLPQELPPPYLIRFCMRPPFKRVDLIITHVSQGFAERFPSLVPFTTLNGGSMRGTMKTNLANYQPLPSFAGMLLAFSLFGLFHTHQTKYYSGRGDTRIVHFNRGEQRNDDNVYTPPRSPGFNELAGG